MKKVVIIENDRKLRGRILEICKSTADIVCVGAYSSAKSSLIDILEKHPDVVLMGIEQPGMSYIKYIAEIKRMSSAIQVIMIIANENSHSIICILKAGANGCMLKTDSPDRVRCAISDACEGGAPLSSPIARKVVNYFNQIGMSLTKSRDLSIRQREIMGLLIQGFTYKEIGHRLEIGTETVRTHVKNVCRRMGVHNRTEAVAHYS